VTAASAADGRQLKRLLSRDNTGSEVCTDSDYRSQANERWLAQRMLTSRIHRRKPAGKPMPRNVARANPKNSAIRAAVACITDVLERLVAGHPQSRIDDLMPRAYPAR